MTTMAVADLVQEIKSGFACGVEAPEGLFQLRMNNVRRDGSLDLSTRRRVPLDAHKRMDQLLLAEDDILLNATNSPDLVGKTAIIPTLDEPATFSNHFLRIRVRPEMADARYLTRWLQYQFDQRRFQSMCRQWVNQASVSADQVTQMQIELPPLPEQRRIAAILDRADALRTKRRQVVTRLDALTQSIFEDMFGDVTSPPDAIPLSDWVEQCRPITYGILKPGPDFAGGVAYVRVADIQGGRINIDGIRHTTPEISRAYARSAIRTGDLLISIRGHVGRTAVVQAELDGGNITQDTARIAVANSRDATYVRAALESVPAQRWMGRHIRGVAVRGINLGDLRRLPIARAPEEKIAEFAERVATLDASRQHANTASRCDEALFASLQSRAFRGE